MKKLLLSLALIACAPAFAAQQEFPLDKLRREGQEVYEKTKQELDQIFIAFDRGELVRSDGSVNTADFVNHTFSTLMAFAIILSPNSVSIDEFIRGVEVVTNKHFVDSANQIKRELLQELESSLNGADRLNEGLRSRLMGDVLSIDETSIEGQLTLTGFQLKKMLEIPTDRESRESDTFDRSIAAMSKLRQLYENLD